MKIEPPRPHTTDLWTCVESSDGVLKCSCGRTLVKKDEFTWACSYGFPEYRIDRGEVMIDKFGRLMLKQKSHEPEGDDAQRKKDNG